MAGRLSKDELDAIATDVIAAAVPNYRGRGVPDEALAAAGAAGVSAALAQYEPERGYRFETWCAFWVKRSITSTLAKRAPAPRAATAPPIFAADFVGEVEQHLDDIRTDLLHVRVRHARLLYDLVEDAGAISPYGLAFFDLFRARYAAKIEGWIVAQLATEQARVNRIVANDEQVDYGDYELCALELPADGERGWTLLVGIVGTDELAHFTFDGWALRALAWSG